MNGIPVTAQYSPTASDADSIDHAVLGTTASPRA